MKRYLNHLVSTDLARKMVMITGPRQVGKTTLCKQLMDQFPSAQYLNWDVPADRAILSRSSWNPRTKLLAMDEIHKMPNWKNWLKGVVDGNASGLSVLVTGSARMDTWRQSGDSLAGRYFSYRFHPISVKEWCEHKNIAPWDALSHLMERGGFPEPCLAENPEDADRWRRQYFTDIIREDVVEFSRLHEINAMRLFVELLRDRVGAPLSLASIARDLGVSPNTLKRYLDILQALYIVFPVTPWNRNVARAILQTPKVYFFDTGLVRGGEGIRFENAVACMLLKHVHFLQDSQGKSIDLHYIRTKDGAEVDFALSEDSELTHLLECKISDTTLHRSLMNFAGKFPKTQAIQLVRDLRQEEFRRPVQIADAALWLNALSA
jgi:predicted AAA+ superfamily ATPase